MQEMQESHTNVVNMNNFQPNTVKRMVQFMYTGNYDDPDDEYEASLVDPKEFLENNDGIEEGRLAFS